MKHTKYRNHISETDCLILNQKFVCIILLSLINLIAIYKVNYRYIILTIKRGQVYRCNFGCGIGSEMQKERPALIIQNNIANLHSGNTIVILITHDNSTLPCVANITPQTDSMGTTILDGQANTSNMMCVSKARLKDYICSLPMTDIKKIDKAIAKTVGLFSNYLDFKKRLNAKLNYITKIKDQRNKAQDELSEIRKFLEVSDDISLREYILNFISQS